MQPAMRSTVLLLGSLALAAAQQGLRSVKTEGGSVVISSLQDVFIEDANGVRTGLNARFSAQQVSWACLRAATIGRAIAKSRDRWGSGNGTRERSPPNWPILGMVLRAPARRPGVGELALLFRRPLLQQLAMRWRPTLYTPPP